MVMGTMVTLAGDSYPGSIPSMATTLICCSIPIDDAELRDLVPEPRGRQLVRRRAEARDEAVARLWRIPEAQLRVRRGYGPVQGLQQLDGLLSRRRVRRALALLDGEGPYSSSHRGRRLWALHNNELGLGLREVGRQLGTSRELGELF